MSLIESIIQTVVGFVIAILANYWVLNLLGVPVDLHESATIGLILTFVSVPRSYAVRRFFNYLEKKNINV